MKLIAFMDAMALFVGPNGKVVDSMPLEKGPHNYSEVLSYVPPGCTLEFKNARVFRPRPLSGDIVSDDKSSDVNPDFVPRRFTQHEVDMIRRQENLAREIDRAKRAADLIEARAARFLVVEQKPEPEPDETSTAAK